MDDELEEEGICLDNDSPAIHMLESDEGIPINGGVMNGHNNLTHLSHEQQQKHRTHVPDGGCRHEKSCWDIKLELGLQRSEAIHFCLGCGIEIGRGQVASYSASYDGFGGTDTTITIQTS